MTCKLQGSVFAVKISGDLFGRGWLRAVVKYVYFTRVLLGHALHKYVLLWRNISRGTVFFCLFFEACSLRTEILHDSCTLHDCLNDSDVGEGTWQI